MIWSPSEARLANFPAGGGTSQNGFPAVPAPVSQLRNHERKKEGRITGRWDGGCMKDFPPLPPPSNIKATDKEGEGSAAYQ